MESGEYSFTKRIIIEGMDHPIYFMFCMLRGDYKGQYKVWTNNPPSDFNMHLSNIDTTYINIDPAYIFEDEKLLPRWLRFDKNAQKKLSEVIVSAINSNAPKKPVETFMNMHYSIPQ